MKGMFSLAMLSVCIGRIFHICHLSQVFSSKSTLGNLKESRVLFFDVSHLTDLFQRRSPQIPSRRQNVTVLRKPKDERHY